MACCLDTGEGGKGGCGGFGYSGGEVRGNQIGLLLGAVVGGALMTPGRVGVSGEVQLVRCVLGRLVRVTALSHDAAPAGVG